MIRKATAASWLALILAASATVAPALAQTPPPGPPRFDEAIAAFETTDKTAMPPKCATLFVGSSSIRFWRTLKEDFPDRTVINRGFGGSTVWEVDAYFDRVVAPYKPKEIVFYAGDNDLASAPARDGAPARAGRSPDTVYADFVRFMDMKDKALGSTPVYFISVKPSKLRWEMQGKMTEVNAKVKALADKRDDLAYIDVVTPMLKPDGTPKDVFVEDNLHMTPEGYAIWTPVVDAALDKGQKAKAPGC
jgi:lysophospholipase L1-like esterase